MKQITFAKQNHNLTNTRVWSHDGKWIVYDVRSDDSKFDGLRIERVCIDDAAQQFGKVEVLYESHDGSHCGVITTHPSADKYVFILGPENPTPDWSYSATHRQGVMVDAKSLGKTVNLDARDVVAPFTPGALRGGSHVHVYSPDARLVSFTYEDHLLAQLPDDGGDHDLNQRNIGVSVTDHPVQVPKSHARNHDGHFSVLVTKTVAHAKAGSDEITKAFEEGWVGNHGYLKADGLRQKYALAFQGNVKRADGSTIAEVFVVDIPDDLVGCARTNAGRDANAAKMPSVPEGCVQRRLTFTGDRKYPGIAGPRHWLRSSPDGSAIAFLMKDDAGIVQLYSVSPAGGKIRQITSNSFPIDSAFNWSPDGNWICHVADRSVFVTAVETGKSIRLTPRCEDESSPLPGCCDFSPDGKRIAFMRRMMGDDREMRNQIFVVSWEPV